MSKENLVSEKNAIKAVSIDLIFTFLPIIVLILIKLLTSSRDNIFTRSDWSYISMILFGQSIIKVFAGVSENTNKKNTIDIILHMTILIAFGLVPTIIILILIETGNNGKIILMILKIIWVVFSTISYLFFGTVGNILSTQKSIRESDFVSNK
jgi:hypothetical protein